jgi:transcriptional regulator with XRE-family HTH domain
VNLLKKYIMEAGLTQREIARRLGISAIAVNNWVREGTMPRPEYLVKLASMLGVSIDDIVRCQIKRKTDWREDEE